MENFKGSRNCNHLLHVLGITPWGFISSEMNHNLCLIERGVELELVFILFGLFIVAILYSSVGHGGASGYLAILSFTTYGVMSSAWLKQHAWCLNLVVSGIAFYHYHKANHHIPKLTWPFVVGSVPFAILGGYLIVDGVIYDTLLSIVLVWAAYRLLRINDDVNDNFLNIPPKKVAYPIGGGIGFVSGIIGVGGGIFLSPIMLLNRWATPKNIAATSALFIWINSAAGIFGAIISNQLSMDFQVLIPFVIVVIVGGYIGSKYGAVFAPQNSVRKLLVIVLLIAATKRVIELIELN